MEHGVLSAKDIAVKGKKSRFILKEQNGGNILTVHHTIKENNKMLRIVLSVCCFDLHGTHMVAIDRRGCIFIFNFTTKRYWRHNEKIPKPSVAVASRKHYNQYVIGNKEGTLAVLDVETNLFRQSKISEESINEISFPGQPFEPKNLILVSTSLSAFLIDLDTFNCSYRLDFDKIKMLLKFASFLPHSDHIMTVFTNDALQVWSCVSLEVVRVCHPIRLRDKKLQFLEDGANIEIQEFTLDSPAEKAIMQTECMPKVINKDITDGLILNYAYKGDSNGLLLSTWDNFLLLLSIYTFEITRMYRLNDFALLQLAALAKPNDNFVVALTNRKAIVLLDCENVEYKLNIDLGPSRYISVSADNKYLAVSEISGELSIWSLGYLLAVVTSQKKCISTLRRAFKQKKPVKMPWNEKDSQFQEEMKKLLAPQRLQQILEEYNCYPNKYRAIIWCSLLKLPNNRIQYQELLQMGVPAAVSMQAKSIQLKNPTLKRSLINCWSCLAKWCKVLAYSETLPELIFPFVKMFQKNPLAAFEVCCTLVRNQFQLFFEYHPLEPSNYLGLCTNILQHFDNSLYEFYKSKEIKATTFAWTLLRNAFSVALDEDQWLCLWDNVLTAPTYYLCFVVVAYNILLKEVIIRLPDSNAITVFFKEQNPININKLVSKAYKLLHKCPAELHPQRYFSEFQEIPPNVYPKFLKYPQQFLKKYEQKAEDLKNLQTSLESRMRDLELEELNLIQRLENGLRQEEHTKRMKEIEEFYQTTLKREEERITCQRKMLLLYQKEIRQRKGEVVAALQNSSKRKAVMQKERELNWLQNNIENKRWQNDINLMWAEEELHNHDFELLLQKALEQSEPESLNRKYDDAIKKLHQEQELLNSNLEKITSLNIPKSSRIKKKPANLDDIESKLDKIQKEFQIIKTIT